MAKKGGLSSLIPDTEVKETKNNKKVKSVAKKSKSSNVNTPFTLDENKIDEIKEDVIKNPRISLWSVKSAATFKYLKKTVPEFSISKEASSLLEEAICNKYPEIWELFDDLE